jgi:hypothetical protein
MYYYGCTIVINEGFKEITVGTPKSQVIKYQFEDTPTIEDLEQIQGLILEAYGPQAA